MLGAYSRIFMMLMQWWPDICSPFCSSQFWHFTIIKLFYKTASNIFTIIVHGNFRMHKNVVLYETCKHANDLHSHHISCLWLQCFVSYWNILYIVHAHFYYFTFYTKLISTSILTLTFTWLSSQYA